MAGCVPSRQAWKPALGGHSVSYVFEEPSVAVLRLCVPAGSSQAADVTKEELRYL